MPANDRDRRVREEADFFCGTKSGFPQPCKVHSPSLEELQGLSFSDFVRTVVLKKAQQDADSSDEEDEDHGDAESSQKQQRHNTRSKKPVADLPIKASNGRPIPFSHGMAKVSLPKGFWDEHGICEDSTGRGENWESGTKLGDMTIPSPIKQCIRGIGGIYEYTFLDQPPISVAEFRQKADEYFFSQVGKRIPASSTNEADGDRKNQEDDVEFLERKFWKRLGPTMPPAMYGADMEGTLFGEDECSGWNLSKLQSCLQLLRSSPEHRADAAKDDSDNERNQSDNIDDSDGGIPGVTTPYLYFGMWASAFSAHTEDMNLLSINYLHAGAPKVWYAIAAGEDAKRFEQLCEGHYPQSRTQCPDFLRHKRCLVSPHRLKKAGIQYTRMVQYPGEAMITFPASYHFGFNTGFNIAEATNFAVPEWVAYGKQANVCLCRPDSVRIDMNKFERLLERYDAEQQKQSKYVSWKDWAFRQANSKNCRSSGKKHPRSQVGEEDDMPGARPVKQPMKKEFWVEVMQPISVKNGKDKNKTKSRKKQTSTSRNRSVKDVEVWHLAKPLSRKALRPWTKVLCIIPASAEKASRNNMKRRNLEEDDENDEDEEECFAGTITELTDDHVRIRLEGLSKKDDVWMPIRSSKLFLDGGRWEEEQAENALPSRHYWLEEDSRNRCV